MEADPSEDDPSEDDPAGTREPGAPASAVRRRRSLRDEPKTSLKPVLLSGRSLEGPPKQGWRAQLSERRVVVLVAVAVVVVLVAAVVGKQVAERSADTAMEQRAAELSELLDGATPEDFLAFAVGVQRDGSLSQAVRDQDGFVNLRATVDLTFMRFQPSGWWSGFTERCLVAEVRDDGVRITTPKTNCNRVSAPES